MGASFAISRIPEFGLGALSGAVAVLIILMALRVAPGFTLSARRRALTIFVAAEDLIVASEVFGVMAEQPEAPRHT